MASRLFVSLLIAFTICGASSGQAESNEEIIHIVGPGTFSRSSVTTDAMWQRIRKAATTYQQYAPLPRAAFFDITYPATPKEYRALAGFGVLLVTVVTQDAGELPLARVYLQSATRAYEFALLSSIQSPINEPSVAHVLGLHRFDALYLFPMHVRWTQGKLLIDFSANRDHFSLGQFPLESKPDGLPNDPPSLEAPPTAALVQLLKRELPGFVAAKQAGVDAYKKGDYATALKQWRPLAEQGDASVQFRLAYMYVNGYGVPEDMTEAARWYRRAAEQGLAPAQFNLGWLYFLGRGVPQDDKEAVRWYRLAAAQGDAKAQTELGWMYGNGRAVPQDDK